jgi:uncharacterized protein
MTGGDRKPANAAAGRPNRKCPICGKPADDQAYPFCSRRCANVDLNRWLSGNYVIPAAEDAPAEDEDAAK